MSKRTSDCWMSTDVHSLTRMVRSLDSYARFLVWSPPVGRPSPLQRLWKSFKGRAVRLSQIQDVAGCRLIVSDVQAQDRTVKALCGVFEHAKVIDRRVRASHGYRAVHVVVSVNDKGVEIQVRTQLQHLWAELSEKLSDVSGLELKYGGGDQSLRGILDRTSQLVADVGRLEVDLDSRPLEAREAIEAYRAELARMFRDTIDSYPGTGV